jgi:transcriptional regulator GlxA family with amidase domain
VTTDVAVLVYEGFDELDAIGPFEVLSNAAREGADLSVRLVAQDPGTVTANHGLRVDVDGPLPDADAAPSVLVVPGGGWSDPEGPGARAEADRGALPAAIADLAAAGTTVATVCTGGMLAARAGLTDGRPAVTHRGALDDLRAAGADVVEARVVDDGDLVTAGGVTAGLDLAFHLVEREFGVDMADRVAAEMEYERGGRVHSA